MDEDSAIRFLASLELPETELSKAYRERNAERFAKYGWDFVSDATAHSIFDSVVRPSINDFTFVKKGVYVKQINEDIFHVITFKQGRYGHVFGWGVSLSFVPHKWDEGGCKFHRTLKSARRDDLWEHGRNLIKDNPEAKIHPYNEIDINHGTACFFEDLMRAWENLQPVIRNWLASITTLEDVLRQAKLMADNCNHYGGDGRKLVYAFTLAKMGKFEEGLVVLEDLMKSCSQFYSSDELPKALRLIADLNK
jgi:hypothetical protein